MAKEGHTKNEIRKYVSDLKAQMGCMDCGINDPRVLDFDHIEPKKHNISRMIHDDFPLKEIKREIAKCEVVCSNCHRIRTHNRLYKKNAV